MKESTITWTVSMAAALLLIVLGSAVYNNETSQTPNANSTINRSGSHNLTIKYRDTPVDVSSGFEYMQSPNSTVVKEAWYDKSERYMIINLNGTNYHYCNLPTTVWDDLGAADSKGSYYNTEIKGNFDCRIYTAPSYE